MLEFDTPFHARIRKLKPPTSSAFDPAAWLAARDAASDANRSDLGLVLGATWIAREAEALRQAPRDSEFEALDAGASVTLAIATINREFLTAADMATETMTGVKQDDAISFGYLTARPLPAGPGGQRMSLDDVTEAAGDSVESWLFDTWAKPASGGEIATDLAPIAARAMRRYSIQHALNDFWNQCCWEGLRLTMIDGQLTWAPEDRKLATRLRAGLIRQAEYFMNFPFIDLASWAALDPQRRRALALRQTVTEVSTSASGRRKIRVGRPACLSKKPPSFLLERAGLEQSYLGFLLDQSFPNDGRLSCRLILQAWHVILDLAQSLARPLGRPGSLSWDEARSLALLVSRRELQDVLNRALEIDESTTDAVIAFLSFRPRLARDKGHRGLWAAPIVPIPSGAMLALALPALAISNSLRKTEAWLERGGIDDTLSKGARGALYETEYRRKICDTIANNKLFTHVRCAPRGIKKDAKFNEQVDLLIRLCDLLIVGEVKCWLFPADSFERFNHLRKLKEAASQANRKARLLQSQPNIAAEALGLTEEECQRLRVVPLVIMNQGFGFSLTIDGCAVTDALFLLNYLGAGTIDTSAAIDRRTGQMIRATSTFYDSETQAAQRFEGALTAPAVLQRFIDRISWTTVPFPCPSGELIYFTIQQLGDLAGAERTRAQRIIGMISG